LDSLRKAVAGIVALEAEKTDDYSKQKVRLVDEAVMQI
jgi:hypothetical protein